MIAEVHSEGAIDVDADNRERDAGCAVEPRHKSEQREDMIGSDGCDISPVDLALARAKWKWQRRFVGRDEGNSGVKFLFQQACPTNEISSLHDYSQTGRRISAEIRENGQLFVRFRGFKFG